MVLKEKEGVKTPYSDIINWFEKNVLELHYTDADADFNNALKQIEPLCKLVDEFNPNLEEQDRLFFMEIVIWSLSICNKLDKTESEKAFSFDSAGLGNEYFGNN